MNGKATEIESFWQSINFGPKNCHLKVCVSFCTDCITAFQEISANTARSLLAPLQTTRVAFTAYLDKTLTHLGLNHIIQFNKVLLNEGNTGIFHCPKSGIYLFSFSIESERAGAIVARLVIDGTNQLDAITDGGSGYFEMAGVTAIARVTADQSVWVATYQFNDRTLLDTNMFRYTSFPGVSFILDIKLLAILRLVFWSF